MRDLDMKVCMTKGEKGKRRRIEKEKERKRKVKLMESNDLRNLQGKKK